MDAKTRFLVPTLFALSVGGVACVTSTAHADPAVANYTLVSSQRVTRTEYSYTYNVTFQNPGNAVKNVVAHVSSNNTATTIVDGDVNVGSIGSTTSVTSNDTITIRQDRTVAFNSENLQWQIAFDPDVQTQSATIGSSGGVVNGPDGVSVDFLPGAVTTDTTISIARDAAGSPPLPSNFIQAGSIFSITPHNALLEYPATVSLPFDRAVSAEESQPVLLTAEPGEPWRVVDDASIANGTISASTMMFSHWVAGTFKICWIGPPVFCLTEPDYSSQFVGPANLPVYYQDPVHPDRKVLQINQPTTLSFRTTVGSWLYNPSGLPRGPDYCLDTPTIKLYRGNGTIQQGGGYQYSVLQSAQTTAGADFNTTVDASMNGFIWFQIRLSCRRVSLPWVSDSMMYGQFFFRVDIPTAIAAPTISGQPQSETVVENNPATFSIMASAPDSLSVTWQESRDNGATWTDAGSGLTLPLPSPQLTDSGTIYRAKVCNVVGSHENCIYSNAVTLTVTPSDVAPAFTQQPADQSVVVGQTATFTAEANGVPVPTIHWYRVQSAPLNDALVRSCAPGATSTTCSISTGVLGLGDSGTQYYAVADNGGTPVSSHRVAVFVTSVVLAPNITSQPQNQTVREGDSATFCVVATGSEPLNYQWFDIYGQINGATQACYSTPPRSLSDNGLEYVVRVWNGGGDTYSNGALLTVTPAIASPAACTSTNPAGWCWIQPKPQGNRLTGIATDGANAVAVGDAGTSLRSSDYGATWSVDILSNWQVPLFPGSRTFLDVARSAPNTYHAIVNAGEDTFELLKSVDGGTTWTQTLAGSDSAVGGMVGAIAFANESVGVAGGQSLWYTDNGGNTWENVYTPQGPVEAIVYADASTVFAFGNVYDTTTGATTGVVYRSVDGGYVWDVVASGIPIPIYSAAFADANIGLAVGDNDISGVGLTQVFRTTDGGQNWTSIVLPGTSGAALQQGIKTVAFADATHAFLITAFGGIWRSDDAGATWSPVGNSWNAEQQNYQLRFADASHGIVVGEDGFVARTSDGGATWIQVAGGANVDTLYSVSALANDVVLAAGVSQFKRSTDGGARWNTLDNAPWGVMGMTSRPDGVAFAVSLDGKIYRSADAGETWSAVHQHSSALRGIAFANSTVGIAVGDSGTILRTEDGGTSWMNVSATSNDLVSAGFASPAIAFATGRNNTLLRSEDGGRTWQAVSVPAPYPSHGLVSIAFTSASVGTLVGDHAIYQTIDAGRSWATVATTLGGVMSGGLRSVQYLDATNGIVVGGKGHVLRTTNGGQSWGHVPLPTMQDLHDVAYVNSNVVIAVGQGGTILRNQLGGAAAP
jgi:photosystem II stability/assembly factor-like uncharacterized protein